MFYNYLKIAFRHLVKNRVYALINIVGLAIGMALAILIGLWLHDEWSVNKSFRHYDRIAQVMGNRTVNGKVDAREGLPIPLAKTLQTNYGTDFKRIVLAWWTGWHTITMNNRVFSRTGNFMTAGAPEMLSLTMLAGSREGLQEPASILLSASAARALFADQTLPL